MSSGVSIGSPRTSRRRFVAAKPTQLRIPQRKSAKKSSCPKSIVSPKGPPAMSSSIPSRFSSPSEKAYVPGGSSPGRDAAPPVKTRTATRTRPCANCAAAPWGRKTRTIAGRPPAPRRMSPAAPARRAARARSSA